MQGYTTTESSHWMVFKAEPRQSNGQAGAGLRRIAQGVLSLPRPL